MNILQFFIFHTLVEVGFYYCIGQWDQQHGLLNNFGLSKTYLSAIYTPFPKQTSWRAPYITEHVCYQNLSKAAILIAKGEGSLHCSLRVTLHTIMKGSWRHQCLLLTLLAFVVLSEGSRLPKAYWEQMLPKKLPSPSSSPSKGTNSVTPSSSSTTENDGLPTSDGKV